MAEESKYITKKKKPSWITKKSDSSSSGQSWIKKKMKKPEYITKKKKYITKKSPAEIQDRERVGKAMGGSLKPVPAGKKGLAKLPTKVRNKMGFMKNGGSVHRARRMKSGGLAKKGRGCEIR